MIGVGDLRHHVLADGDAEVLALMDLADEASGQAGGHGDQRNAWKE